MKAKSILKPFYSTMLLATFMSCTENGQDNSNNSSEIEYDQSGQYEHAEDILLFESHELIIEEAYLNPRNTMFTREVDGETQLFIQIESLDNLERDPEKKMPLYLALTTNQEHVADYNRIYPIFKSLDSLQKIDPYEIGYTEEKDVDNWKNSLFYYDSIHSLLTDELNEKYYNEPISLKGYLNLEFVFTDDEMFRCRDSLNFTFLFPEVIEVSGE